MCRQAMLRLYCTLCALIVALCSGFAHAALFPPKTPVVQLSQASFSKEVLQIEKPALVAFTAPWCGHCQRLAPEFHRAATNLDGIVKFANIDCDQDSNKGLCAQYQIQGFPTIKLFPATKKRLPRDYRGERSAKALVEYAKDTLPLGARKLPPLEMESWLNESPGRAKVILFSDKPKSSPLYRSLALDFRKTLDFAHMRGDEPLVRSQGRLVLGVDIPTANNLPVLLIIKARDRNADGSMPEIEKGAFEAYEGPLKYWKIKKWLDDVAPKMGGLKKGQTAEKSEKKPNKAKSSPKAKSNKRKEQPLPDGGAVEWKVQGAGQPESKAEVPEETVPDDEPIMDETAPGKDTWRGKMLDIERAGEIADQLREEHAKKAKDNRKKFPHLYPNEQVPLGTENFFDKAKAAAGSLAGAAAQAYKDASDTVGEHVNVASQIVRDAAQNVQSHVQDAAAQIPTDRRPFEQKSQALMKQFEKWMGGEAPEGWEESLGDTFAQAQAEAEALLRNNPEEARRQAWEAESWLLKEMENDRARMQDVMTSEQKAQVDNMIDMIKARLAKKETTDPFQSNMQTDSFMSFGENMKGENRKQQEPSASAKNAHDEL